ncbi:endo alpha-1,4 polygalactosaminidase, partial [Polaromonas sp.]|uniref:endo alpha-1,4 polygalactosaminidase n=1 Tax=Polaromonas sp. TaxID=1869339 RepID=UPI0034566414
HGRSIRSRLATTLRHAAVLVALAGAFTAQGRTLTIIGDTSTTTDSSPTKTSKRQNQTTTTTTTAPTTTTTTTTTTATTAASRGFPNAGPWASFYGTANTIDLPKLAATFRIMDIDADPDMGNFTASQITTLKNSGANKVLSYLNLGSCENFRGYWSTVPTGFLSCSANKAAQLGAYSGYSNEVWMNVGNADYQNLVINYIVPRLVAQGVDGFYFDNMEIVEHGTNTTNGPCDAQCSQGGLNLIAKLRDKYPSMLFVMQNATSNKTRLGQATGASGTVAFPSLLDGIAHEEVYKPTYDAGAEAELVSWSGMNLAPGGRKFWIGTLDYVSSCTNTTAAESAFQSSRARGFSPSVSDSSAGQQTVCYWPPTF